MNNHKAPNLIISPKRKEGGGGAREGALNDESIYTHTYTHTLSLSPPSPSLSLPPPPTHTHLSQCKEEKATGTGKDASLEPI